MVHRCVLVRRQTWAKNRARSAKQGRCAYERGERIGLAAPGMVRFAESRVCSFDISLPDDEIRSPSRKMRLLLPLSLASISLAAPPDHPQTRLRTEWEQNYFDMSHWGAQLNGPSKYTPAVFPDDVAVSGMPHSSAK